jgi:integrase
VAWLAPWVQIPPPALYAEPTGVTGELFNYAFWMQKQGYRPSTTRSSISTLKAVAKKAKLLNQDAVKTHLASMKVSASRKEKICQDLARFYKFKQTPFDVPRYHRIASLPFLPQEKEIDQLISACGKKTATFLQLLKETGIRPGEAWELKWKHFDFERASVTITPEKGSNARQLRMSSRLIAMLNALPRRYEFCFRNPMIEPERSMRTYQKVFAEQRRRIALKLQNPRIEAISFRTLRHWRASSLYHSTKDILLVKSELGHKSLTSTLVYTHLILFKDDDYVCKVARSIEEGRSLIESGFEYVTEFEDAKLFKKRK